MTDLNERVQAELDRLWQLELDRRETFGMVPGVMAESWRERWERHDRLKPHYGGILGRQYTCKYDGHTDPCPDKLSILREIGIAP